VGQGALGSERETQAAKKKSDRPCRKDAANLASKHRSELPYDFLSFLGAVVKIKNRFLRKRQLTPGIQL
jgi:hypothetical protein